jgi:hypothetical protein
VWLNVIGTAIYPLSGCLAHVWRALQLVIALRGPLSIETASVITRPINDKTSKTDIPAITSHIFVHKNGPQR